MWTTEVGHDLVTVEPFNYFITMLNDDYIPGTNVRKPRPKNLGETDDEYLDYLDKYYGQYFNNGKGKGAGK